MILQCSCQHTAQDQLHGKGKRVHNLCKHETQVRCTVCKSEKTISNAEIKKIKAKE